MSTYRDLTGEKFEKLTVIGVGERNSSGRYRWKCQCECGRVIDTYASSLISGHTKSCGKCITRSGRPNNISGMKFGRLTALYPIDDDRKDTYYLCVCDCGNYIEVPSGSLRTGNTRSCGCLHHDFMKTIDRSTIKHAKHGGSYDENGNTERLYNVWRGMKRRCYNQNSDSYEYYGGRGIEMCDEWRNDYATFRDWSLSHGYDSKAERGKCTIDRIDNFGNYEPDNCRFVTMAEQNKNKRKKRFWKKPEEEGESLE